MRSPPAFVIYEKSDYVYSSNVDCYIVNKRQGTEAEKYIRDWLGAYGYHADEYSLEEDFKHHVDIAAHKGRDTLRIDVKADYSVSRTSNVCFETWNCKREGRVGWGLDEASKAEIIIVVDAACRDESKPFYVFRLADLRRYYAEYGRNLKHRQNDPKKDNEFAVMPLKALQAFCGYWHRDSRKEPAFIGKRELFWKFI